MKRTWSILIVAFAASLIASSFVWSQPNLPVEPDEETRLEEIYDHESRMVMFLYSLKGTDTVDYVVGRKVWEHQRSSYGNPVYYVESYHV